MLKTGLLLLAGTLAVTGSLFAVPTLRLSDGATTRIICDQNACGFATDSDASVIPGIVSFNGSVGTFSTNVSTGITKPISGTASEPILDLDSVNASGVGTLTVTFTETDFTSPLGNAVGTLLAHLQNQLNTPNVAVADIVVLYDSANGYFVGAPVVASSHLQKIDSLPFGPFPASSATTSVFPITSTLPYSLTLIATITHSTLGTSQLHSTYSQVPEPGFYGALALGLSCLFVMKRRRTQ